jgi:GTP-binding protein
LISRISAAHPKIAGYPFTTLEPCLGVVSADGPPGSGAGRTFVVADIPGLIEGAHEGAGLGIRFLRHIERTRLLAHLVDASDASERDPAHDFDVVIAEVKAFNSEIAAKPMIVVGTKIDAAPAGARLACLREHAESLGLPFFAISAVTGAGIPELVRAMAGTLDRLPKPDSSASAAGREAPHHPGESVEDPSPEGKNPSSPPPSFGSLPGSTASK